MIESRSLRLFVLVAEELHFGRAAERANITPSVLSVQISRLEDTLGFRLLNRNKRAAITLTQAGSIFLPEAELVVAQLDRAERIGRLAALGQAGTFRLAYVFSAAMCGLLEQVLTVLQREYPFLEPQPQFMETPEQLVALASGQIDLGLMRPRPAYPPGVAGQVVHAESLLIALAAEHPLAQQSVLRPSDLAGETFIIPQFHEPFGLIVHLANLARIGNFSLGAVQKTGDFVTAVSMAGAGYGVALAPKSLRNLGTGGVIFRELDGFSDEVELVALHQTSISAPVAAVMDALAKGTAKPACRR